MLTVFAAIPLSNLSAAEVFFLYGAMLTLLAVAAHLHADTQPVARPRSPGPVGREVNHGTCRIWIDAHSVRSISGTLPACVRKASLRMKPGAELDDFLVQLGPEWAELVQPIRLLALSGIPFCELVTPTGSSPIRVVGNVRGRLAELSLEPASEIELRLLDRLEMESARAATLEPFRSRAEESPVPAYELDAKDRIIWRNASASALLEANGGGALKPADSKNATDLLKLRAADGDGYSWVRLVEQPRPGGGRIIQIEKADHQVRAEEALQSFIATMTDTFAHLDIALAIFDADRRLSLFNPALCDMFGLAASDLAARPSLRLFLERLRAGRMIPEQPDFGQWRSKFGRVCENGETHHEDWTLPSGKILRVSARPHPKGAIAYTFEDISGDVQLERQYHAAVEMNRTTLDHVNNGVAVLIPTGEIAFANRAFNRFWQLDADGDGSEPTLDKLLSRISAKTDDTDVGNDLASHVLGADTPRAEADYRLSLRDGRSWLLRVRRLSNGFTLILTTEEGRRSLPCNGLPPLSKSLASRGPCSPTDRLRMGCGYAG